jgi:hypothetical protein
VICLDGRFDQPIHVWGRSTPPLLFTAAAPGHDAVVAPGRARASDVSPGECDGVAVAVRAVGSTAVEVRGLTITDDWARGTSETPAGILVEVRGRGYGAPPSACFTHGTRACGGIYLLLDDHASDGANLADDTVVDTDNVGIDIEGWCDGTSQTAFGLIEEDAVAQTDQGISLDSETAGGSSSATLVTGDWVVDTAGARRGDPSYGPNPPRIPGRSDVAGHAYDAFYVDAFGRRTSIEDVYATENVFVNASRSFGGRHLHHDDVVTLGGRWSHVEIRGNTIVGGGSSDPWTTLLGVDTRPVEGDGAAIDCNDYEGLSPLVPTFSRGDLGAGSLASWRQRNGYGWDRWSAVGARSDCPAPRGSVAVADPGVVADVTAPATLPPFRDGRERPGRLATGAGRSDTARTTGEAAGSR